MARIFDPDGDCIAEATLELPENGTTARLHRIKKGAGLLNFYFGRGKRWVVVDTPDGQVRGRLRLSADLRPDAVLVPWGWAVPANELVGLSSIDPLTGAPDQEGLPCALRAV